jgi:hypothetical protein
MADVAPPGVGATSASGPPSQHHRHPRDDYGSAAYQLMDGSRPPVELASPVHGEQEMTQGRQATATNNTGAMGVSVESIAAEVRPEFQYRVPPYLPVQLLIPQITYGALVWLVGTAVSLYRIFAPISQGCFFDFSAKDFDTFKRTGALCDAPFVVAFAIGVPISLETYAAMASAVVALVPNRLIVIAIGGIIACWQVVRVALMITFLLLPLPMWTYCLPAIVVVALGVLQLIFYVATLRTRQAFWAEERQRVAEYESRYGSIAPTRQQAALAVGEQVVPPRDATHSAGTVPLSEPMESRTAEP